MLAKNQENQSSAESKLKITIEASSNSTVPAEGISSETDLVEAIKNVLETYKKNSKN